MKSTTRLFLFLSLLTLLPAPGARAQTADDPPKYEFRGAWIATVLRLDWPKSTLAATQQTELITMLDRLKAAGINAVLFQVRSEADAMYASELEPWSHWLMGQQGKAPAPFYDPLAFAVEEAHKRGMELHAWLNPYRVQRNVGNYARDSLHVSVAHPEWTFTAGSIEVMDPGLPDVRDHISRVVADVVRRYDVDGIHFDDYFYPYPPNQVGSQDDSTFARHSRGFTNRGDWRRDNINLMVAQVSDSIDALDPTVKFGISPFGIWKNGVPSGVVGMDAYNVIYADATAWLDAGDIDYITPQLYWPFGGGQDFAKLAPWWMSVALERHLYVGHGLYRTDAATFSNALFAASEIPRQVRFTRQYPDIQGSVFFRAENITRFSSKGFADSLKTDLYRYPALTPVMPWKDLRAPAVPHGLVSEWTGDEEVTLRWEPPVTDADDPWPQFYAVYRVRAAAPPAPADVLADARNLLAVTGRTELTDRPGIADDPYYYFVTSVSANSVESEPSNSVALEGRATAVEAEQPAAFVLHQNYPNPFNPSTTLAFTLDRSAVVSLRVYNVLGQQVAALVEAQPHAPGTYTVSWDGTDEAGHPVASGTYFYELEAGGRHAVQVMTLLR